MPKMKTRRSVAKRFRKTASGKLRMAHAYRGHLLTGKNRNRKRRLRRSDFASRADEKRIGVLLPYR
ncbi:MAG: 50S ribosomal protein L35 [Candidatus Omnitrophica bacterium]|nr:50S ribosomal protein L35 [Candidatus Omnitrophota bacterium]